jgi:hypothetical protein
LVAILKTCFQNNKIRVICNSGVWLVVLKTKTSEKKKKKKKKKEKEKEKKRHQISKPKTVLSSIKKTRTNQEQ